ncbi:alpha/beta fold hydrolase [Nocardia otitidiscaviarum]|uniref:Alpha/beta fold hydrolase n=1 Tax=Nocardia otitidiscaviarum TaxID=1823 RepID=A0A516NVI1_9NOCA|nr:epoxide hydrolase family protein [Nocardia otitidiscaviarum]MCP9622394.1 epoxide hydrolase 1 [Nocardia otitidiscaviarum]QDP82920.1 alpha/beta fold hydrolase [Nocardia otitidiscaviarum]
MNATTTDAIRTFRIEVPQADLDDLRDRLARTRWADQIPGSGDTYGVSVDRVRHLVEYWQGGFDWRAVEAKLNAYPQFITEIDGQDIHFLHVRSERENAFPLILTHGWPGTFVEFLGVIEPLTAAGFDLVIPSIPGFGFAGPTTEAGWNNTRIATAWAELMRRLGYRRYGAVGNDGGSQISAELGRVDAEHMVGSHVAQVYSFPSGDPAEMADLTEGEAQALETLDWFAKNKMSFNILHSQQPQTLAHAIMDSPAGLVGWLGQLLGPELDDDFVLTHIAIHWLTGTAGSATRIYFENARAEQPTEPTTVPMALSGSNSDFHGIRRFADRDHNIVSWKTHDVFSHYLHHSAPELMAGEITEFYAQFR